jgi:activating signal cointegrator 1
LNTIYTLGYAHITPAWLKAKAEELGAIVVDIRMKAWSQRPEWRKDALQAALGGVEYRWCPNLGNRNYSGVGPIELNYPQGAVAGMRRDLERQPVILLCQCADWRECHRKVAAEYLSGELGAPIVHIEPEAECAPGMVKVLSLNPPYGSLIAVAADYPDLGKHNETRSWPAPQALIGQTIAIHQTKGRGQDVSEDYLAETCNEPHFFEALAALYPQGVRHIYGEKVFDQSVLPRGAIIATAKLVACHATSNAGKRSHWYGVPWNIPDEPERSFGDYSPGRYAWELAEIKRLPEPLPARGFQGLWSHEWAPIEAALKGE